jgi:predicted negative regulator of RcsB-dependent stress response
MESDVAQSADIYRLIAWAHANRQRLIAVGIGLAVVVLGISVWSWNGDRREAAASDALSAVASKGRGLDAAPVSSDDYLQVANDYSGTGAAARALLLAGAALFDAGKYPDAEKSFERFLSEYPDNSLAPQAEIGVAASLEAQGKTSDSADKYKDFINHHQGDPLLPQAKSSLARLCVALNRPDEALRIYQEMRQTRNNDSWTVEAGVQADELLAKYPSLRPPPPPPAPVAAPGLGGSLLSFPQPGTSPSSLGPTPQPAPGSPNKP